MKRCIRCDSEKEDEFFSSSKTQYDGLTSMCKECDSKRKRDKSKTSLGLIAGIYRGQKQRQEVRYSVETLAIFILTNKLFYKMMDEWKSSDYDKMLTPSIDRIDPNGIYEISNIHLVTWGVNKYKGYSDRKKGIDVRTAVGVGCFDLEGNLIKSYKTIRLASEDTGVKSHNIKNSYKRNNIEGGKRRWKVLV